MTNNPYAGLTQADFLTALQGLLPPGAAWSRAPTANMTKFLAAIAQEFADVQAAAGDLSEVESDPSQASALLPDWERAYGLPDPCVPQPQTVAARQMALVARIGTKGGQSRAYFIAVAAALGFTVDITEFKPFRTGHSRAGDPDCSAVWRFVWQVDAAANTVTPFRAGQGSAGEPLRSWGNTALECVIRRLAPAHTIVQFAYGS